MVIAVECGIGPSYFPKQRDDSNEKSSGSNERTRDRDSVEHFGQFTARRHCPANVRARCTHSTSASMWQRRLGESIIIVGFSTSPGDPLALATTPPHSCR